MSHSFHYEYKGNVSDTALFDVAKVNAIMDLGIVGPSGNCINVQNQF